MIRNCFCRWYVPLALALSLAPSSAFAAEIKLARNPDYHDGKVAFSYLGDIWVVNEDGTNPQRMTVHPARDINPRFSPDGKWIAFSSDRAGNQDVYIMPATGGKAKQLTFHSANDLVVGWTPDSKRVVFQSSRGMMFPGIPNLYEVPINGDVEQAVLTDWGYWGSYSPSGDKLAFNRHPMAWSRQHYRGSYAADLWLLDVNTKKFKRIVDDKLPDEEKANNLWPMYGQGGDIYFVSDRAMKAKSGDPKLMKSVNNIWKVNDSTGVLTQVTKHTSGRLFWPSISSDGKVIVYEENFGLWKLDVASGKTTEIKVNITVDDAENNQETLTFNGECDGYYVSPSGKRAVISVHGELFTIATDKGETRRLTSTPNLRERQPSWSPDGKWIAFIGEKDGVEHAMLCDEKGGQMKQITGGDTQKGLLQWSPDGSALLYTASDNKLYKYSIEQSATVALTKADVVAGDSAVVNPQWSPDGKWISFTKADRASQLPHVYIMPASGGEARRVTLPDVYSDTAAQWTPDGKYLVYLAGADVGNSSVQPNKTTSQLFIVALVPEEKDGSDKGIDSEEEAMKQQAKGGAMGAGQKGAPVEVKIDFAKLGRRARQLTSTPDRIMTLAVTPDSKSVVFTTSGTEGGRTVQSLWTINVAGGVASRVAQGGAAAGEGGGGGGFGGGGGYTSLQFAKDGRTLFYKQGKSIYALAMGGGPAPAAATDAPPAAKGGKGGKGGGKGGGAAPAPVDTSAPAPAGGRKINFVVKVDVDHRAERQQVLLEAWRVMKHRFYDAEMHGADWNAAKTTYLDVLEHVGDTEELHSVINMMLGELNASHTGISGGGRRAAGTASSSTRHPGFEMEPDKSGYYKVTHVYKNGPCDVDYAKIAVGDFVMAINDTPLKAGANYWKLYTQTPNDRFEITVNSKPSMEGAWKFRIKPIAAGQMTGLQYARWVEQRRDIVDRISNGEIGYLHIQQMNEGSLKQFERDLAMLAGKKALIIDQRFNPGGNIDQELLAILQQKQYQKTQSRGSVMIPRPLRGFFGPMVVMANERSTSDAEVFPDGFKTLKLGKVVGVTTYGAVIGTGSYTLMDGSTLRTPGFGLWNVNGTNLENHGIVPDVYVDNTPEDFFAGRDAQVEKAVEVLRGELTARK
jgi:tricorn protease